MDVIWTPSGLYRRVSYEDEKDLESAILEVQSQLFGPERIYLNVKKLIGKKGEQQNIPDGYLVDLTGEKPRLFVVENELASHDPLRHVAVQILQFSLAFEDTPVTVRDIILQTLNASTAARERCELFATEHGYDSLFEMVDWLVHSDDAPFTALVIIDEMSDLLERALTAKFRFGLEVLELARFENADGAYLYQFDPFLEQMAASDRQGASEHPVPTDQIDTIVFSGTEEAVKEQLFGERRWYATHISGAMRPQIRYMAVYESKPIQQIRYLAPVASIDVKPGSEAYVIRLADNPEKIGPVKWIQGGSFPKGITHARYTDHERLMRARTLEDAF